MLDRLTGKFSDIFRQISGKANISEKNIREALNEIKIALLEADVNLRVVRRFINQTAEEALGGRVLKTVSPGQMFTKLVFDKMVGLLGDKQEGLKLRGPDTVSVVLLLGLQGSGKTTTAGKLAYYLKKQGRKPLLVAADLVRPAAVEQLTILAEQCEVAIEKVTGEKNPVKVVKGALKRAAKDGFDTVLVDTAGRLQIDQDLMRQIKDIRTAAQPDEVLLVADAMTGHNAVDIAAEFDRVIGLSGVILSKFDSDTRGGAALSIKSITGKPLKFIGVGEKLENLEVFYPDRIASRILGMGDVVSLVEKAQETVSIEEAELLRKKIEGKNFTLEDYLDQFRQIKKMGNMQTLMEMIPGFKGNVPEGAVDEDEFRKKEAIILSMTFKERQNHLILNTSRRRRVAAGSGTNVYDVNRMLKEFEKTRLSMRKVIKNPQYQENLLSRLGM